MPSDDLIKSPDFDPSAQPGAKRALKRMVIWWDRRYYRRYCRATIGSQTVVTLHSRFQVVTGGGQGILGDPQMIPMAEYETEMARAKKEGAYAEVKNADKDPNINQYEAYLIEAIAQQARFTDSGSPLFNIVPVPDAVKNKFEVE